MNMNLTETILLFIVAGLVVFKYVRLLRFIQRKNNAAGNPETPNSHRIASLLILVGLVILLGLKHYFDNAPHGQPTLRTVQTNVLGKPMTLEVADTEAERQAGLSNRIILDADHGMIFLFPEAKIYPFWMKEMRFPLDIIYLRDGVVDQIFANVPPPVKNQPPQTVIPSTASNEVLEVFGGESGYLGWKVGDRLFDPQTLR